MQKFFQDAGNAEQFDSNESVTAAAERLRLPNLNSRLPGLEIVLMPHQVIGVSWMLDKEHSKDKGGILSDEMGLGKVRASTFDNHWSCIDVRNNLDSADVGRN